MGNYPETLLEMGKQDVSRIRMKKIVGDSRLTYKESIEVGRIDAGHLVSLTIKSEATPSYLVSVNGYDFTKHFKVEIIPTGKKSEYRLNLKAKKYESFRDVRVLLGVEIEQATLVVTYGENGIILQSERIVGSSPAENRDHEIKAAAKLRADLITAAREKDIDFIEQHCKDIVNVPCSPQSLTDVLGMIQLIVTGYDYPKVARDRLRKVFYDLMMAIRYPAVQSELYRTCAAIDHANNLHL